MNEIWKDIEGYEGIYQVSDLGRVRSLDRIVPALCHKTGTIIDYHRKGRILKQRKVFGGYMAVGFEVKGNKVHENHYVHRLVARTFVRGYREGLDVNHKDEDKTNNRADNLEWCDRQYNINYGTGKWRREKFNARPVEQLTTDGKVIARYDNASQAARAVGCDPSTINAVCRGKPHCNTAKGYRWKFINPINKGTMTTDYTPYVIIDDVTMSKVMERLNQGKAMAEKSYPHLTADFERVIKQVRERAECFTGSQNKPKTTKAYGR